VLKPGGRLAIADIVSDQQMKESIVCDADPVELSQDSQESSS
jgi:hypothetical protein